MKQEHYRFITEYLRWGDEVIAFKNAYNTTANYQTLEAEATSLLQHPDVATAIQEVQAAMRQQLQQQAAQEKKGELLTLQRKRELLCKIAMGDIMVEQNYKGKDCNVCTQFVRPTINQMLRAIHLDSKLANHYPQPVTLREQGQRQANTIPPHETPGPVHNQTNENSPPGRDAEVDSPADINTQHNNSSGLSATSTPPQKQKNIQNHNKTQQIIKTPAAETRGSIQIKPPVTSIKQHKGKNRHYSHVLSG